MSPIHWTLEAEHLPPVEIDWALYVGRCDYCHDGAMFVHEAVRVEAWSVWTEMAWGPDSTYRSESLFLHRGCSALLPATSWPVEWAKRYLNLWQRVSNTCSKESPVTRDYVSAGQRLLPE